MNATNQLLDFSQIDEITAGDPGFKKELMGIFLCQIPEFVKNMTDSLNNKDLECLARESHSAKSSVLIFGMESTGGLLKKIEQLSKDNIADELPELLGMVEIDLNEAYSQLTQLIENR